MRRLLFHTQYITNTSLGKHLHLFCITEMKFKTERQ